MRAYYTDYVNHMLKTYAHYELNNIQNEVDRLNWTVCDRVVRELEQSEQDRIRAIYARMNYHMPRPLPALVKEYCDEHGCDVGGTMNLVRKITKRIKRERGL